MAEPVLTVRSARAHDLAQRLAQRENCSIAEIVERALEVYEARGTGREPVARFYARLLEICGTDIDLEPEIRAGCQPHPGSDL